MHSITNHIARTAGIALAVIAMFTVAVALAPKVHAADLSIPDFGGGSSYDYFVPDAAPSYDYGGGYSYDYFVPDTTSSYDTGSSFGGCSSCGGSGFSSGGFSFPGMGFGGGKSSVFAPSTASSNTSIYAPTNTCSAPNTCNTDDHSIFNAPTTVTVANPAPAPAQQIVYQQVPVYQPPQQYPVYNTPCYSCQQPIVYPQPTRQPYVSLSQAPYTGLDLGPVGTVLYWGFLVAWCLLAAYLIVYKRVQTKLVSGLNSFLFGAPAVVGTHAKVVMPAKAEVNKAYVAPVAKNDDAIDPFIASQIARNK